MYLLINNVLEQINCFQAATVSVIHYLLWESEENRNLTWMKPNQLIKYDLTTGSLQWMCGEDPQKEEHGPFSALPDTILTIIYKIIM